MIYKVKTQQKKNFKVFRKNLVEKINYLKIKS